MSVVGAGWLLSSCTTTSPTPAAAEAPRITILYDAFGKDAAMTSFGKAWPAANFELIDKTTEVAPGLTLIALVSDAPGTKELKELSLAINTPKGIVLVVGCSHPGIENIVAEAAKINPHVHFIAGGLHLVAAQDPAIAKVATMLHDTFRVDYIAPGHCTGEPTFAALQKTFGDRYLYAGLGTTLNPGASPSEGATASASPRMPTL